MQRGLLWYVMYVAMMFNSKMADEWIGNNVGK